MSDSVAAEVKDRLDIVEYVGRYVGDLKKMGSLYKACCPFHAEKTPSFVVNPTSQTWRCFGQCAEGGDIFNFAMKKNGWTFAEALQELGRLAGVETRRERTPQQREKDVRLDHLRGLLKTAADYYHDHLMSDDDSAQKVREYAILQRGFTMDTLRRFQIGYAPDGWTHMLDALVSLGYALDDLKEAGVVSSNDKGRTYDRFRNRLMIPIRDERGSVTGFGARALNADDNPKYLNSPQSVLFDKSRTLFALDAAKASIRDTGIAVIVEGYMDAVQAHQAGFTNVVAQMGTALTDAQLQLLVPRYTHKLILALDADAAGQNAMRRSLEVARQALATQTGQMSAEIRIMQMDGAKDPDDVLRDTPELWPQYVEQAVPVADFVIRMETEALPDHATLSDRQAAAQNLLPILAASENSALTRDNLQKLALAMRLDERDVFAWADALKQQALIKAAAVPAAPPTPPVAKPSHPTPAPIPNLLLDDDGYAHGEPPPYFGDMEQGNSEEPPPYFGDVANPAPRPALPPPPPLTPMLQSRHQSRAAEAECVRQLAMNFDFFYDINRTFRELCGGHDVFADHALSEFTPQDFGETDLRLLVELLIAAHKQDDESPDEYVQRTLDPVLYDLWSVLLRVDAEQIHTSVGGRMHSEMEDIIKKLERSPMTAREQRVVHLRRVLDVRDKRLRRELVELTFLLRETPREDTTQTNDLITRMQEIMRAQNIFQRAMGNLLL